MHQALSLDWLRFTVPPDWLKGVSQSPSFIGGHTTEQKSILSYNTSVGNEYHSIHWHTEHPEFKVMVEITGSQLSALRKTGHSEAEILADVYKLGGKVTRLDFAVDLFDTEGRPFDMLHAWECGQVLTTTQKFTTMRATTAEKSKGETVYIGSRQSERMLRVYDKGAQTKTKLDWLRVELELKGERAVQCADIMSDQGVNEGGLSMLRDMVEWTDVEWFEAIFTGEYELADIDAIGRPETDRERWLRTVVIPVIAEEVENGAEWLVRSLEAILDKYQGGHGPQLTVPHQTK